MFRLRISKVSLFWIFIANLSLSIVILVSVLFLIFNDNKKPELLSSKVIVQNSSVDPIAGKGCSFDEAKLCSHLSTALARDACLFDNIDKVSKECRLSLNQTILSFDNCSTEIKNHCSTAGFGGGRMLKCLKENSENLSELCKKRAGI